MEENKHPHIGHETSDVDTWAVGKFGIGLLLLCIATLGLIFGVFRYFQNELDAKPGATAVVDPVKVFPQPQLQTTPVLDLQAVRAEETQRLTTYGWVDQPKGVVRIPIDRAIELLAARGLPARTVQPPAQDISVPTESSLGMKQHAAGGHK